MLTRVQIYPPTKYPGIGTSSNTILEMCTTGEVLMTHDVIFETNIVHKFKVQLSMRSPRYTPRTPTTWDRYSEHMSPSCGQPGGKVVKWTMMGTAGGGDHEGYASTSGGTRAQDSPEPALERQVVEVAPGKTTIAVVTLKPVYRITGDAQDV